MASSRQGSLSYMPVFVNDWLTSMDIMTMSSAARGCYMMLLTHQWKSGILPHDTAKLARLCFEQSASFAPIWSEIEHLFVVDEASGGLFNQKLHGIRETRFKQAGVYSDRAKAGSAARWGAATPTDPVAAADRRNALRRAVYSGGEIPEPVWKRLIELCGNACVKCKRTAFGCLNDAPRIDEKPFFVNPASIDENDQALTKGSLKESISLTQALIIPPSAGGLKTLDNLQPLCRSCARGRGRDRKDYRPAGLVEQLQEEYPFLRSVTDADRHDASSILEKRKDNTTHYPLPPETIGSGNDVLEDDPEDDELERQPRRPSPQNPDARRLAALALQVGLQAKVIDPAFALVKGPLWELEQLEMANALLATRSFAEIEARLLIAAAFIASKRSRQRWSLEFVVNSLTWDASSAPQANAGGGYARRGRPAVVFEPDMPDYNAAVVRDDDHTEAKGA